MKLIGTPPQLGTFDGDHWMTDLQVILDGTGVLRATLLQWDGADGLLLKDPKKVDTGDLGKARSKNPALDAMVVGLVKELKRQRKEKYPAAPDSEPAMLTATSTPVGNVASIFARFEDGTKIQIPDCFSLCGTETEPPSDPEFAAAYGLVLATVATLAGLEVKN